MTEEQPATGESIGISKDAVDELVESGALDELFARVDSGEGGADP